MNSFKAQLLAATVVAGMLATSATAQVVLPAPGPNDGDASLHGAGATSIQTVLVQTLNCVSSTDNQLATSGGTAGTFANVTPGVYTPASPTATDPAFDCATQFVQPNFQAKYVATGSGFGRQMWSLFSPRFDPVTAGVNNPFEKVRGQATWTKLQFAFSDTIASPSDITTFNANAGNSTNRAGPAIQFPLYVLPVAIAYNPRYGTNAAGVAMNFAVRRPLTINGVAAGGLALTRDLYCKVFNGEITNFNDPAFTAANSNVQLRDIRNDAAARFNADGVPVRLVGRLDRSGTTDIFTRHLAAACDTAVAVNKFDRNAETLPFDRATNINFSNVRADTGLQPTSTAGLAGTVNSVGGEYSTGTAIIYNGVGPTSNPTGNRGSGLFLVADGSSRVRDTINLLPDYALNGVTLNGKIGYIASDFIRPAPNATLFAAALQVGGTGTRFAMPSAANGSLAFGSLSTALLPPQSDSRGIFNTADSRIVRNAAGANVTATRDNPIAWGEVLYAAGQANNLANPVAGYPITGTAQYLGYTCYANTGNRYQLVNFLGLNFGKILRTSTNAPFSRSTFGGTLTSGLGTVAQSNIALMPIAWQYAITETFLTASRNTSNGQALSTLGNNGNGLYMQNRFVVNANDANPEPFRLDAQSNPGCTAGAGA